MTTPKMSAIGYCVDYGQQGEWAFSLALEIARRYELQLNVFHFATTPFDASNTPDPRLEGAQREQTLIEMEKKMRLHFDELLGDYLDVGFRLCEKNEWTELHHCLCEREFQLLVMGLPSMDATFGKRKLVEFADSFVCPVALVGPETPNELTLNEPARLLSYRYRLDPGSQVGDPVVEPRWTADGI